MPFDTSNLTKKQYELILQILQMDNRRSLPSILKQLDGMTHQPKRTVFLRKIRDELLIKKSNVDTPKKNEKLFLQDFADICNDIKKKFIENPKLEVDDFDFSQYQTYYGEFSALLLKQEAMLIQSLLFSPENVNKDKIVKVKISNKVCPLCLEKFSDFPDSPIIFLAKNLNDAEKFTFDTPYHLQCYMITSKSKNKAIQQQD